MSQISLDVLVHEPRLFNVAHDMTEQQIEVLRLAHRLFDDALSKIEMSMRSRMAIDLGVRTFEVVSGVEIANDVGNLEFAQHILEAERTGNFVIQLIEDINEAGLRLPDTFPELAEASERIVVAHMEDTNPALVLGARSGAGIMHEIFTDTYLSSMFEQD